MEAAGLVVGLAGLAGLFGACIDAIERVDSYKNLGLESRYLIARFEADKLLFRRWADAVGIEEGKLNEQHHTALNDTATTVVVARLLSSIREVFDLTEGKHWLQIGSQYNDGRAIPRDLTLVETQNTNSDRSKPRAHRTDKVKWSLLGRTRFATRVEAFGTLVEKLYALVQPSGNLRDLDPDVEQRLDELTLSRDDGSIRAPRLSVESGQNIYEVLELLKNVTRKEVFSALGAIDTQSHFESLRSIRVDGTCDWVFETAAYEGWRSDDFPHDTAKILWKHAPAGHGKTVTAASIISRLLKDSGTSVAYFLYSSEESDRKEPFAAVRAWIYQLATRYAVAFEIVEQHIDAQPTQKLSEAELWRLLKAIVTTLSNVVLIIDGLDECPRHKYIRTSDTSSRETFLENLKDATTKTQTRVLIVSRDEVDIRSQLQSSTVESLEQTIYELKVSKDQLHDDVTLFSRSIVDKRLPNKDLALRQDLTAQLARKSEGMFLWVRLHATSLRKTKNRKQLTDAIDDIPLGLESAFERSWNDILNLPSRDKYRAIAILRWILFARRPLTVTEVTVALVIRNDDSCFDLEVDDLPDCVDEDFVNGEILGLCGSLLELRSSTPKQPLEARTLNLVHFTAKEYLLRVMGSLPVSTDLEKTSFTFTDQHNYIGHLCLRYLNYQAIWKFIDNPIVSQTSTSVVPYMFGYWVDHVHRGNSDSAETIRLLNAFFSPGNPNWYSWRTIHERAADLQNSYRSTEKINSGGMLYYAAYFGLDHIVRSLAERHIEDINAIGGVYGTALQAACAAGYLSTVQQLVSLGAELDIHEGCSGSAINAAIAFERIEIIRYLIALGASLTIADSWGRTPVHITVYTNNFEVLQLLVQKRAHVNSQDLDGQSPLGLAAATGKTRVVRCLLEAGADMGAKDKEGWIPLTLAAVNGEVEIVQLLLDRGGDMTAKSPRGMSLLSSAARNGHHGLVTFLLDNGADLASTELTGGIALIAAVAKGSLEITRLLLDRGANIYAADHLDQTPLMYAVNEGNLEMVRLLLERGADVAVPDKANTTPLMFAVGQGHLDVVRLLLEMGADVAATDNVDKTAMMYAASEGRLEIAHELLDHGAQINSTDIRGNSALHLATLHKRYSIVEFLLASGADTDIVNIYGLTALYEAVTDKDYNLVQFLLNSGTDTGARDIYGRTALHLAAQGILTVLVQILIEGGADPLSLDGYGRSSLDWAIMYPPCFQAMGHLANIYNPTAYDTVHSTLKESLRKSILFLRRKQEITQQESATPKAKEGEDPINHWHKLGKCLLFLGDMVAAVVAFEQATEISDTSTSFHKVCDQCLLSPVTETCYVCTSCADVDVCEPCYLTYQTGSQLIRCKGHDFLKVPRDIWKELEPGCVDKDGKDVDSWLAELLVQYA